MSRRGVQEWKGRALAAVVLCGSAACELVAPIPDLTSGGSAVGVDAAEGGGPATASDAGDASADATGAPMCPPTALYCNPFEDEATLADFIPFNVDARIDSGFASNGVSSLRLDPKTTSDNGFVRLNGVVLPRKVFVRAMVKLDLPSGTIFFFGMGDFSAGVHTYVGGDEALHVNNYSGGDTGLGFPIDVTARHCIELGIDDATQKATVWLDDRFETSVPISGAALPYPTLALVVTATTTGAWYDDLVVATQRIGCP